MNKELVEKNVAYQQEVEQIAKYLFRTFYFDQTEEANHMLTPDDYEKEMVKELLDKAEKILSYFDTAREAKKALRFLHTVNPTFAEEIVDAL